MSVTFRSYEVIEGTTREVGLCENCGRDAPWLSAQNAGPGGLPGCRYCGSSRVSRCETPLKAPEPPYKVTVTLPPEKPKAYCRNCAANRCHAHGTASIFWRTK